MTTLLFFEVLTELSSFETASKLTNTLLEQLDNKQYELSNGNSFCDFCDKFLAIKNDY